ncbi:unnamed protein product [Blepharisma stoltei]|uniref:Uncharacterized protein n=1 Tax=Blepharisma stoltei TaxID=1481888 RepID=A0AAU9JIG5_9CILI|nr:unnamed protein product [Blepharisma stoltei]
MGCIASASKRKIREAPSFTLSTRRTLSSSTAELSPTERYVKNVRSLSILLNTANNNTPCNCMDQAKLIVNNQCKY